jgi:hypothetical protein
MVVSALVIFGWKDTNMFDLLSFGVSQQQSEIPVLGARHITN